LLHLLGEVEVVFGLWAVVLLIAITAYAGWESATHYVNDTVDYTEPLFVAVIIALAATRPIVGFAEAAMRRVAHAAEELPPHGGSRFSRSDRFSARSSRNRQP
jgi:hypothetical protein